MTISQSSRFFRSIARLAFAGLIAMVPASGIAQGQSGKLDAVLSQMMQNTAAAQRRDATILSRRAASGELLVEATMRFHGNGLVEARALGVEVHSVLGNIATVSIPVSKIGALADLESVEYLEAEHRVVPRLDKSVPITRADRLRTGVAPNFTGGLTGKGVIVGIIDEQLNIAAEPIDHKQR